MRASWLDRRVKKEAKDLVRTARAALAQKPGLQGKAGDLATVTSEVETALQGRDLRKLRDRLPVLDALVDALVKRSPRSATLDYIQSIGTAVLIALALRAFVIEAFKIPSSSMYPTLEIGDHIFVNKFIYGVRIPWTSAKLFELRRPHRGEVIVFMQPCETDVDYIKRVIAVENDTVEVRCNVVYVNGAPLPSKMIEDGNTCHYDDYNEATGQWSVATCSKYVETIDGTPHEMFQDPDRPARDARHLAGALERGDRFDFPQLNEPRIPKSCATYATDHAPVAAPNQLPGKLVESKPGARAKACEPQLHYVVPPGHVFAMGDNRANSNDSRFWGAVPFENIKGKAMFIWLSYAHWGPLDWTGIRWSRIGDFVK